MRVLQSAAPVLALALLAACGSADDSASNAPAAPDSVLTTAGYGNSPELAPRGAHWTREAHAARKGGGGGSPLMTNHGGKIMPTYSATSIFWGSSWSNATSAGDKITGVDSWYAGHSNSNYARTSDEYTGTNGPVTAAGTYSGHLVDTSAAVGGGSTSAILAEVCKMITSPDPTGNGYYPVYTDVPRGNAAYCAWHSAGSCGGVPVQFAFFWRLDGDSGCDPQDTSGLHSEGLAALASVTAHELAEARTDPASPGAWYDGSGNENGDKCAWSFGAPLVTFPNGSQWKLQGEWSNAAYTANTGYANNSGQHGCLSGL